MAGWPNLLYYSTRKLVRTALDRKLVRTALDMNLNSDASGSAYLAAHLAAYLAAAAGACVQLRVFNTSCQSF